MDYMRGSRNNGGPRKLMVPNLVLEGHPTVLICYNTRMIRAVIFDMDGVMIDTEHIQSKAFEDVLAEYGITAEKNEHGTVHISGATTPETWEILKKKYNLDADTGELSRKKRAAVVKELKKGIAPMPELMRLLNDLREHHIIMAVATSAQRERANLVLGMLHINSYLRVVVTADDVTHGKPAPDIYLKAAELLHVPPEECIVLEDAEVGIQSAKAAHMSAIAVPNQYTKCMDFSQADKVVTGLEALTFERIASL